MKDFGPFSVAIAFWIFVAVAAVSGIVADYKKRKAALEPLRAAIEHGQQLDPALVERLMAPEQSSGMSPVGLKVAGIITCAAGIGVMILSLFLAQVASEALYPVMGGGVVTLCVGIGLILASRAVESHRERQASERRPGAPAT
jgi:hypothetical protein